MASTDTFALIDSLAENTRPVARHAVALRLLTGMAAGGLVTIALVLLVLGPRADLSSALQGPSIWMKWGYTLALAGIATVAVQRLARPGTGGRVWIGVAVLPVLPVAVMALRELSATPAEAWPALWLGHSWSACPVRVVALAVPVFLGLLWAFRGFAPTRLRAAGAVAGFAAGASAATLYGFACTETSALFLLTWYTLGIAVATALGALIGPRVLRW